MNTWNVTDMRDTVYNSAYVTIGMFRLVVRHYDNSERYYVGVWIDRNEVWADFDMKCASMEDAQKFLINKLSEMIDGVVVELNFINDLRLKL